MTEQVTTAKVDKKGAKIPTWLFIGAVVAAFFVGALGSFGASSQKNEDIQSYRLEIERLKNQIASGGQPTEQPAEQPAEPPAQPQSFNDGVYVVGATFPAGVYSTEGSKSGMCYYSWLTSTASDADIIDNNVIDGAVTVTLNEGEVFESKGCKTWTKIG